MSWNGSDRIGNPCATPETSETASVKKSAGHLSAIACASALVVAAGAYVFVTASGCMTVNAGPQPLFECSFDSAEALQTPDYGPTGKFVSAQMKLEFVDGVKGKALRVPTTGSIITYDFKPGFLGGKGCVELWAKILTDKPDYCSDSPVFYCVKYKNGEENLIAIVGNNGAGCSGLYGRMIHNERVTRRGWGRRYPYNEILGENIHGWHHYAFVWNVDGVTGYKNAKGESVQAVMYVDGKPHMDHNLMRGKDNKDMLLRTAALPSVLGFPHPQGPSSMSFLIDEFKIWDYDKVPALQ